MTKYALFLFASLLAAAPAMAQQASEQPIEITASKSVEWLRNDKQYVARENVIVKQGNMTILTDLLTADYRETPQNSMDIWQITATGNVEIKDEKNTAYGDKGVYDVTTGVAVLTGESLRLISPDQTVTAKERMEYYSNQRMAKAVGDARVVRAKDTLTADTITAYFKDQSAQKTNAETQVDAQQKQTASVGGGSLDRIEAQGHVVIKTPTETLHGNKAVYRADTNTAEITGKVKIERGPNVLEGNRAEVDLDTNISKMFGSAKEGGRVRGVFFPGTDKKADGKAPAMPAPFTQDTQSPEAPLPPAKTAPDSSGMQPPTAATVAPQQE